MTDVASARIRPSAWWYALPAAMVLVGVVAAVLLFAAAFHRFGDVARADDVGVVSINADEQLTTLVATVVLVVLLVLRGRSKRRIQAAGVPVGHRLPYQPGYPQRPYDQQQYVQPAGYGQPPPHGQPPPGQQPPPT